MIGGRDLASGRGGFLWISSLSKTFRCHCCQATFFGRVHVQMGEQHTEDGLNATKVTVVVLISASKHSKSIGMTYGSSAIILINM